MDQHGAYNNLQAFSHFCLAHCQAHGQWVWQRAKPLSKALDLTPRQTDTHLGLKGVGSSSTPHLQSLRLGMVPSPGMVAIWVWHIAKPKGDSSGCSLNPCPIMLSTQLSQERQVWYFTRTIPPQTRQVPSPRAVGLAAFQTLVCLDSVHNRAQRCWVQQHTRPITNWVWHTTKLKVDGSRKLLDSFPIRFGVQPSLKAINMTIHQTYV